ncbi:hypothetical protein GCM10009606_31580 [Nocardioides aquiterrae]|uniref:Uncharacterized protein n=1 Tax=Nocardioides aquiterrae TaxID=203799 RepID=A0ABN1UHC7_9ACTN
MAPISDAFTANRANRAERGSRCRMGLLLCRSVRTHPWRRACPVRWLNEETAAEVTADVREDG